MKSPKILYETMEDKLRIFVLDEGIKQVMGILKQTLPRTYTHLSENHRAWYIKPDSLIDRTFLHPYAETIYITLYGKIPNGIEERTLIQAPIGEEIFLEIGSNIIFPNGSKLELQ